MTFNTMRIVLLGLAFAALLSPVVATHKVGDICTNKKYRNTLGCSTDNCQVVSLEVRSTRAKMMLIVACSRSNAFKSPVLVADTIGSSKRLVQLYSARMEHATLASQTRSAVLKDSIFSQRSTSERAWTYWTSSYQERKVTTAFSAFWKWLSS